MGPTHPGFLSAVGTGSSTDTHPFMHPFMHPHTHPPATCDVAEDIMIQHGTYTSWFSLSSGYW